MNRRSYTFELPLYVQPTEDFRQFIKDLGSPLKHACEITYYTDGKLLFFSRTLPEKDNTLGKQVSFTPFDKKKSTPESAEKFIRNVSTFASFFHCSIVPPEDRRLIFIDLSDDTTNYQRNVKAVLKVTSIALDEGTISLYESFFSCFDPNREFLQVTDS